MLPVTSSTAISASHSSTLEPNASNILDYSKWVIQNLKILPGMPSGATADNVEAHRAALLNCLSQLQSSGRLKWEGEDTVIRPVVVGVQAIIEQTLLCLLEKGVIKEVAATFTTKKPPTPLSTAQGALPDSLATPAVLNSSGCIDTVTSRQQLLRKLITYPQVSMSSYYVQKHEAREQEYFDKFSENNATHFYAQQVAEMPEGLSGATYQITTIDGQEQWFGIRFSQVSAASGQCTLFTNIELEGEKDFLFNWIAANNQIKPDLY